MIYFFTLISLFVFMICFAGIFVAVCSCQLTSHIFEETATNDRFRLMYVKLKQIKCTWLTRFDSPFALILLLPVFVNIFQTITKYVCQCLVRD